MQTIDETEIKTEGQRGLGRAGQADRLKDKAVSADGGLEEEREEGEGRDVGRTKSTDERHFHARPAPYGADIVSKYHRAFWPLRCEPSRYPWKMCKG